MELEYINQRLKENLLDVLKTCEEKTNEYANGTDPFITIKRLALLHNVSPSKMCMNLCSKHYLSLFHDIDTLSITQIRDRIHDLHIYLEYAELLKNDTS